MDQYFYKLRAKRCIQEVYSTSGPAEPISSKVSRSQNLTVLSAEPEKEVRRG